MRYKVCAYLCTNFTGLMNSLETSSWDEIQDFVWENIQKGYHCECTDRKFGEVLTAYATEETVEEVSLCTNGNH